MRNLSVITVSFLALLSLLSVDSHLPTTEVADVVYLNGNFYTVDENKPHAEAVAIRDGKFILVGTSTMRQGYISEPAQRS